MRKFDEKYRTVSTSLIVVLIMAVACHSGGHTATREQYSEVTRSLRTDRTSGSDAHNEHDGNYKDENREGSQRKN